MDGFNTNKFFSVLAAIMVTAATAPDKIRETPDQYLARSRSSVHKAVDVFVDFHEDMTKAVTECCAECKPRIEQAIAKVGLQFANIIN